jgi:hypothetical protein
MNLTHTYHHGHTVQNICTMHPEVPSVEPTMSIKHFIINPSRRTFQNSILTNQIWINIVIISNTQSEASIRCDHNRIRKTEPYLSP